MPPRALITRAEYARRRGVSKRAVTGAVQSGRIKLVDGLVDPKQADRDWKANTDASKQVRKPGPAYGTYSPNRAKREAFAAQREELAFLRETQKLVDASEVERLYFARARRARNMLLAIPAQLGAVLAGISDPTECERRLKAKVRHVCEELAGSAA
jgi:hypothetical protein